MPFRILCADESLIIRQGIEFVCGQNGCTIDRFVSSVPELYQAFREEHYDVLVCDARIGQEEMVETISSIRKTLPDLKVILYTDLANPTLVAQAVANQFYDFVLKSGSCRKLVESLASIPQGFPPSNSLLVKFKRFMTQTDWPAPPSAKNLTRREFQVAVQLSLGLSNKGIAGALGISLETVKEHVQNILRKLKVSDRTAAAVWTLRNQFPTIQIDECDER